VTFDAHVCENGHVTYPGHTLCPDCGAKQTDTLDLSERTGEVVTWTKSTATPPGVRAPNTIAIVQFDLSEEDLTDDYVRAVGQVTTEAVETGDAVEPTYVEELRDPEAGIKVPESQDWDGYRFEPV
jgi:uncharacterized OB-fold protein